MDYDFPGLCSSSASHYLMVMISNMQISHARNYLLQVVDGTFVEEPGSGAVATVENKKVSVGTFDWVQRYCGIDLFILGTWLIYHKI